jgi:hypothetical protein
VNQVWNYANEVSARAARPFAGAARYLSGYDLDKLTAGATEYFGHIGSETIQRVNAEFATRRKQVKKTKLRWRVSRGSKRSLGWIPFKAVQLKRKGKCLRFSGKSIRVFEKELLQDKHWKCGCFAQDPVGSWWLCLPVECPLEAPDAANGAVGLDLGLKDTWPPATGPQTTGQALIPSGERCEEYPVRGEVAPRPCAGTSLRHQSRHRARPPRRCETGISVLTAAT